MTNDQNNSRKKQHDHVPGLVERYFNCSDGEFRVGGVQISAIAQRHGTPLFVYDAAVMERKWSLLRKALPAEFDIYYSVKANPNQTLLRFFIGKGCGLEVASGGELYQALEAGCKPEQIVFAGPGKRDEELEFALTRRVGEIHVESLGEAERIGHIAHRLGIRADIALRVNPGGELQSGAMRMGNLPAPFGIDEERLDEVLDRLCDNRSVRLCGVHVYAGTQILEADVLIEQYRKAAQIALRVAARLGRPLTTLDFGGGYGIPYFAHERELDLDSFAVELAGLAAQWKQEPLLHGTRMVVEPGRFLVGEAGIYVARVIDVKTSRNKKFLIVDGGMHHHLAASGNLGQTIKRNYPVALLNRLDCSAEETVDVVGPLCTPLDVLARGVKLPKAEVGDLVGIFQSGAYARTASPSGFLSHPTAPEVWVENGTDRIIRRRGKHEDFLRDQCFED
jgi:diaminopimelate decarboxylase